jgi:hypothetical protein
MVVRTHDDATAIPRGRNTVNEAEPHKDRSRVATYESLSIDYVGQQCIITYYGVTIL